MKLPFRRGDDGLTDRQRAKYAKQYAENEARPPTAEEMQRLRRIGQGQRAAGAALRAVADDEAERSFIVTLNNGETHRVVPVWHLYSEAARLDPQPLADWEHALISGDPQKCECGKWPAGHCPVEHHR